LLNENNDWTPDDVGGSRGVGGCLSPTKESRGGEKPRLKKWADRVKQEAD